MSKRKRILLIGAASIAGLFLASAIAAVVLVQTPWFANFLRRTVISSIEDSTGGVAEIGSLQINLRQTSVRIGDAVLHGAEPNGSDPLLRIKLLEFRLRLFPSLTEFVALQYLGIERPELNLILLPGGNTNIPRPKAPSPPSQTSGLQTVVDLAVSRFELKDGLLKALDQKSAFSGKGENLRALLQFNPSNKAYTGNLRLDPLLLTSGDRPPLKLRLNVPVTLEQDAIRVSNASLTTGQSQILLNGSLENVNVPAITASVHARVSLPEIQKSFDLPVNANGSGAPKELTAALTVSLNQKTNAIGIRSASLRFGRTTLDASGELNPNKPGAAAFQANFDLAELSRSLGLSTVQPEGDLQATGRVTLDHNKNYAIDGTLNSRALSLRSGTTRISGAALQSPFHADPFLVSLDGLKLSALGGSLAAKIFLERLQNLSVESHLRNFSLPVLAAAFTGKPLGYDGFINGLAIARGNLKAKGATGYTAKADLTISPGTGRIPVSGRIDSTYVGATGALDLGRSYLSLPNTRIDLAGSLNRHVDLELVSRNLGDLLPAVNFGSDNPRPALPIVLQGGTASLRAQLTGQTARPHIDAHLDLNEFTVEQRPFRRLVLQLTASPSGAVVRDGTLTGKGLATNFDGSIDLVKWQPQPSSRVAVNLTLRNGDLADLAALAGESSMKASGAVTADLHIQGTYADPLGGANLQILNGSLSEQPFGKLVTAVTLEDQLLTLSNLYLETAGGKLTGSGTFRHPTNTLAAGHAQFQLSGDHFQLAEVQALARQNAGIGGVVHLNVNAALDVTNNQNRLLVTPSNLTADLAARDLRIQNQDAGNLTGVARTNNGQLSYTLNSNFAGSLIDVKGQTVLGKDYRTAADASIMDLSVEKALQLAGQGSVPVSGNFSSQAHLRGTLESPEADLTFALKKASVYQEPLESLQGRLQYSNRLLAISTLDLRAPAGNLTLTGSFNHPLNDFNAGALKLNLKGSNIQLARVRHLQLAKPGLEGTVQMAADLSANMRAGQRGPVVLLSNVTADASLVGLQMDGTDLGGVNFAAKTIGSQVKFTLDSDLARSRIHGTGEAQLTGNYPVNANLSFNGLRYSNLAPILTTPGTPPLAAEALVDGKFSVNGPALDPDNLSARLELSRVDLQAGAGKSPTGASATRIVELQNEGPILLALSHQAIQIEQMRIRGRNTTVDASGSIDLKNSAEPLALQVTADVDLGLLQNADRDFYSSGSVGLNANVRGSFAQPRVNGQVQLKNANINYADAPVGISNANGVILLSGTNATIQNLTGESGGGKIAVTGFVGLAAGKPNFNLQASASSVRVRSSGISATSNAHVTLAGNLKRSLLAGAVSIERISYASSSDAGSLLSSASTPPATPASPSPLLSGMRLAVNVVTAPDIQVVSTYTNRLSVIANLTLRGTAESPGILGRVTVTDGQLVFFGNSYTVTTGTVNFYDPTAISPVLNVSLETVAQGVDVTIGVAGPINDLKLSYRSDPPLSFEQIVQLLATNTTPANPVIAAHQPSPPQQSMSQMGESAILGQAVANPLASRVRRVFGLTQFKIDPSFAGTSGQPSARVTLQQKVASNITFTYITDVTQTNSQIVRVQWDLSNSLSAVALRDFNGNVSVEMFYKFTRR